MKTSFARQALEDAHTRRSEKILRSCVHCGFCTATCPTYLLLGDELDSPRGRIYLIKDMLEGDKAPTPEVVRHVDRCLSCLSCMTTCPSGVHYMHLIDHARAYIQEKYRRPAPDRALRWILAKILPYPARFRLSLRGARLARPFAPLLRALPAIGPSLGAMLALAPKHTPARVPAQIDRTTPTLRRPRVVLLEGCAQPALAPQINAAARRLLNRLKVTVLAAPGNCCGALVHHMGRETEALNFARKNIDAWTRLIEDGGLDAIVITTSGCGTTIKDYGAMLQDDPVYAEKAARVSALAKDVSEFLENFDFSPALATGQTIAYHAACSLQHGQKITDAPKNLLRRAGFIVKDPAESHICCGSAGVYNILQPEIADQLRARKTNALARLKPDIVAAGNIGCIFQIERGFAHLDDACRPPVVHIVELLDWACGGPAPLAMTPRN